MVSQLMVSRYSSHEDQSSIMNEGHGPIPI
jgi:hypothetical protein